MTTAPRPTHRLRRVMLLVALFLAVVALSVGGSSWWLSRGEPEWYQPKQADPKELAAASERAEKQIQRTLNWAQDQQAAGARQAAGPPAATQTASSTVISFEQTELNGFFLKWDAAFGWSRAYSDYISDPMIVVRDQKLIVAARVKELGTVVSVEVWPRLEKDQLQISVTRVLAGRLPLPRAMWSRYITALDATVEAHLDDWRSKADITPKTGANRAAVLAAMGELFVNALHDQPSSPVLFLPITGSSHSLPVSITDIMIENQTLQFTVKPLSADEQRSLSMYLHAQRCSVPREYVAIK